MKIKELIITKKEIILWIKLSKKEDNNTLATVIALLYYSNFNRHLELDINFPIKKEITLTITKNHIYSDDIQPKENKIKFVKSDSILD